MAKMGVALFFQHLTYPTNTWMNDLPNCVDDSVSVGDYILTCLL